MDERECKILALKSIFISCLGETERWHRHVTWISVLYIGIALSVCMLRLQVCRVNSKPRDRQVAPLIKSMKLQATEI